MTEAPGNSEPRPKRTLDFDTLVPTPFRLGAIGVVVSLLYSALRLSLDPLFNPDGVFYLVAAEAWIENGIRAALEIYWRPFYSILIGAFALLSGLSALASAHVIDALFAATLLVAVQLLIREFGGDLRIQSVGLVLFLLWPSLDEYRTMIGRDLGYWAAALLALVVLIRYARSGRLRLMGLFYGAVLVAMLFRPEAVVMLLLPFTLVIRRGGGEQVRAVMLAQAPLVFACLLLAVGTLVSERINDFVTVVLHESLREPLRMLETVPDRFSDMRDAFATRVLNAEFHDYAVIGLIAGIIAVVGAHFAAAISWPVLLIGAFGFRRESFEALDPHALRLAVCTIAIVVVMLCVFLIIRPVMQTRFLMLPAFIVLTLAPFAVAHVRRTATQSGRLKQYRWAVGVIVAYLIIDAWCLLQHSKNYLRDATDLVRQEAGTDGRVLSNDARIAYLSGSSFDFKDLVAASRFERLSPRRRALLEANYDYWAVHLRARRGDVSGLLDVFPGWRELGRTTNRKGDQVVVLVSPRRDDLSRDGPVSFTGRPANSCWFCCWLGASGTK